MYELLWFYHQTQHTTFHITVDLPLHTLRLIANQQLKSDVVNDNLDNMKKCHHSVISYKLLNFAVHIAGKKYKTYV